MANDSIPAAYSNYFLGTAGPNNYQKLLKEYEELRKKLYETRIELERLGNLKDVSIQQETFDILEKALGNVEFSIRNGTGNMPVISFNKLAVSFHLFRDANATDGNYVYTTNPMYSFQCLCSSNTRMRLYNTTHKPEASIATFADSFRSLATIRTNSTPIHPHATTGGHIDATGCAPFDSVCVGTNPFVRLYSSIKSPADFSRTVSLAHEWFRNANLSDMYGSKLNYDITLADMFFTNEARAMSEELFEYVQTYGPDTYTLVKGQRFQSLYDISYIRDIKGIFQKYNFPLPVILNVPDTVDRYNQTVLFTVLHLYILAYALWLINHDGIMFARTAKECMVNAIHWDILTSFVWVEPDAVSYIELQRIAPIIFAGPRTMKRHALDEGSNRRSNFSDFIDQIH